MEAEAAAAEEAFWDEIPIMVLSLKNISDF